ncbi:type II toxin-antitoxin system RelB/DinJ family antitoxin [Companilactobacillus kedongensis]|uniref:type II toxin-antitoxin system RelB/DinJ family antitoxin n=1 Tax=Companilactobacillus kedongensis TaxID=2486004 RepID=UPI000F7B7B48|nr:type II toxin-antitoxin system RelB/DinJ family antitoxin [Companilactobacillus kedongensis]
MQMKAHEKKRVQANLDKQLVEQADQVFSDIGLNTTTALTAFYKQVVASEGMPFKLTRTTSSERLNHTIQEEIDSGKFRKITSKEELLAWLDDDDKSK